MLLRWNKTLQANGRRSIQQTRIVRRNRENIEPTNLNTTTAEPAKIYYNAKRAKVDNTTKVANHPPPTHHSGKAST